MTLIKEENFVVPKSARFSFLGNPSGSIKHVWFVLHGYGQLSSYFIRKFSSLENEETLIIAPEGLHRFYLEGSSGRVGASWMTKEDRHNDIQDYVHYLDALYEKVVSFPQPVKITTLGFSQGGATASRWISQSHFSFDNLILWGSTFPPDLDFQLTQSKILNTGLYLVCGNEDQYYAREMPQHAEMLRTNGYEPHVITFAGAHEVHEETLQLIKEKICS